MTNPLSTTTEAVTALGDALCEYEKHAWERYGIELPVLGQAAATLAALAKERDNLRDELRNADATIEEQRTAEERRVTKLRDRAEKAERAKEAALGYAEQLERELAEARRQLEQARVDNAKACAALMIRARSQSQRGPKEG